jgi:hypothetical protein
MTYYKNDWHPEERGIFFALLITDFYSEEDSSFLRMTGWRGCFLRHFPLQKLPDFKFAMMGLLL